MSKLNGVYTKVKFTFWFFLLSRNSQELFVLTDFQTSFPSFLFIMCIDPVLSCCILSSGDEYKFPAEYINAALTSERVYCRARSKSWYALDASNPQQRREHRCWYEINFSLLCDLLHLLFKRKDYLCLCSRSSTVKTHKLFLACVVMRRNGSYVLSSAWRGIVEETDVVTTLSIIQLDSSFFSFNFNFTLKLTGFLLCKWFPLQDIGVPSP